MLDYLRSKRAKSPAPATQVAEPILTPEDEEFLSRITSGIDTPASVELPPTPPPRPLDLPESGDSEGNNAQIALIAKDPEKQSPTSHNATEAPESTTTGADGGDSSKMKVSEKSKKVKWSWLRRDSREATKKTKAMNPGGAVESIRKPDSESNNEETLSDPESKREEDEMAHALEQLNLAAVDNRVFSMSKETRELLSKFTLVLKDLVNGVPTAYNDLESLLTNSDDQLQRSYKHLPSWLQKLVKQLPSKMSKSITPEMLAATAEKHGVSSKLASKAAHGAETAGLKVKVPSLKDLVTRPGAVLGMLKAILNFLKLRFPAFLGVNVLYSLALFVLLLIFWYCHKRGREVRLEKERLATEEKITTMDRDDVSDAISCDSVSRSSEDDRASEQNLSAESRA